MHGIGYSSTPHGENGVTRLVRPLENLEALPTKGEHLGHKGHTLKLPILVERLEDFVLAADFDPLANREFRTGSHFWKEFKRRPLRAGDVSLIDGATDRSSEEGDANNNAPGQPQNRATVA
jgi:hypothetical protein